MRDPLEVLLTVSRTGLGGGGRGDGVAAALAATASAYKRLLHVLAGPPLGASLRRSDCSAAGKVPDACEDELSVSVVASNAGDGTPMDPAG